MLLHTWSKHIMNVSWALDVAVPQTRLVPLLWQSPSCMCRLLQRVGHNAVSPEMDDCCGDSQSLKCRAHVCLLYILHSEKKISLIFTAAASALCFDTINGSRIHIHCIFFVLCAIVSSLSSHTPNNNDKWIIR